LILDLQKKFVMGFQSVIFFHLWKLWLKHGDHLTPWITVEKECHGFFCEPSMLLDIQISYHFV
jgi:hypothetical protein